MTQKIGKTIFILFVLLVCSFYYVQASDINLNLPGSSTDNSYVDNQINNDNLTNSNDEIGANDNLQDSENNELTAPNNNENSGDNLAYFDNADTLKPSNVSAAPETSLSITNIINILLITVGVIIILLAIAIIVRLKN